MRKLLLTGFAIFIGILCHAQLITTVAGGGLNDGIPAITSAVNNPGGTAVDAAGNLYIADAGNNRIRKVDAATGTITTLAGNGTAYYSGDGGAATSAQLNFPSGVAIDAAGNLYIADQYNNRIRKIDAVTGTITTVAGNGTLGFSGDGGTATSARLYSPTGVALDAAGNLYIADQYNNRIRKVNATTGTIITVAGNGTRGFSGDGSTATAAQLYYPTGVALDVAGNLYIADQINNRIRKVNAATGTITTVAGNGTQGYAGDGGLVTSAEFNHPKGVAIDAAGNLYIADQSNNRIRKVTTATGTITTVAGNGNLDFSGDGGFATSAMLSYPSGVAVDAAGNLFIADQWNNRIRKVTASTGIINTVAGNGTRSFSGDGGAATSAMLNFPIGVALDATGNLYIADQLNNRIRKVNATNGTITTVAGNGTQGFSGDGDAATSAQLYYPNGVALDAAGNLFIADAYNNRIRKVNAATGTITTVAGNGTPGFSGNGGAASSATINEPRGVAIDAAGNLFIADAGNNRIRKVDAATGIISTVAGNGTGGYSGDGDAATSAQLYYPNGVAIDAAGNLFIADVFNDRIRKVNTATGTITTVAGNGTPGFSGDGGAATSALLGYPRGVTVDAAGNLFIVDADNNRIRKIDALISITITANPGQGKVYGSADPTLTYTASPALQSGVVFTGALSRAAGESVGNYAISQGNLNAGVNYSITFVPAYFTVNKATLDVTADNATRVEGEANPAFTLSYAGFMGSDDASVIDALPTATCSADAASAIGDYDIVLAGGSDNNYDLVLHNGTLTVTAATGITPNDLSAIGAYPNPTSGTFNITNVPAGTVISVFTSTGQLVKTSVATMDTESIDIQSLPAGMYLVKLTGSSVAKTLRVLKQ